MVPALSNIDPNPTRWESSLLVLKSPLITALAVVAIAAACLPLYAGLGLAALSVAVMVVFPHLLPQNLLYEVSIADLIVRNAFSRTFSCCTQRWWHPITPQLVLGGIPLENKAHAVEIQTLGVGAVCAIIEDFEADLETFMSVPVKESKWSEKGIAYRRFSCPDMTAPSLELIEDAIRWIHERTQEGKKVYIHCKAGRGRSALILICTLIRYQGLSFKEAYDLVSAERSVVTLLPSQQKRIREFEAICKTK